jgi:hypothetical protein
MRTALIALLLMAAVTANGDDWTTLCETSDYKHTPRYEQTVDYCRRLADASPWVRYTTFGTSPRGRGLPLVIVDKKGHFTAREARSSGNVVFLIQACIHAGECDGKDAGMMLIRDIAVRKDLEALLDHVTILFMPIFNVDGHERFGPYNRANQNGPEECGWRTTAANLNLNRDYLKADAPEMRAWLALYTEWLPEMLVDCHVTDGADYQYVVTYAMDVLGGMDAGLTRWGRERFLQPLEDKMSAAGFPMIRYNSYRTRHDPKSGIVCWTSPPRFSTGYATIQNRPSILIETHSLKDYKTRVTGTYQVLRDMLEVLNSEHDTLGRLVREADERAASPAFREQPLALTYDTTGDSVMIEFLGYEYDVVESDISGGEWHHFSKRPATYRIPLFDDLAPSASVQLPEAYIIPPEWADVVERLKIHGINFIRLKERWTVPVRSYQLTEPDWPDSPFEGRFTATFQIREITDVRSYPAGSVVVDMNQRASRVVANILEPAAYDSYAKWGFFNAIFEQKEYIEPYLIEQYARAMLDQDEKLRQEFEEKKASDPEFAGSPRRIRRWFYRHTPYWDDHIGAYPVGRVTERRLLEKMPR